jgi:hypothetical protein
VRRFWRTLEDLPGCAESLFDWKDALGDAFDAAAFLLRKTGVLAARVGCPSPGGIDCPRRVVRHRDGSIVAVCGNQPAECHRLPLCLDDIAVLELDWPKLAAQLCACLGMQLDFRAIKGIPRTWQVGYVHVAAGAAFRVDAIFPTQEGDFSVAAQLIGRARPSALLLATRQHLSPTVLDVLSRDGCEVAVLDEIIQFGAPGHLVCAASPRTLFPRTWAATAPAEAQDGRAWVLPADARWEEMRFEFEAREMLCVSFRNQTRRFEPADLNMQDNKTHRPNLQWVLLLSFARKAGVIERSALRDFDKVRSQKRQLSAKLRAAFGIPGDPIVWVKKEQAYRTRFVISGAKLRNGR